MNKTFSSQTYIVFAIGLLALFLPQNVLAAQLSYKIVSSDSQTSGTTAVVEVRIDPEGKNVNVVEGTVTFSGSNADSLEVDIKTEKSVFPIWPTEPSYNAEKRSVQFVGGTPEGLTKEGLLFTMRLHSPVPGDVNVSWSGVKTFLNDGKGTEESTTVKSISINLDAKNTNRVAEENIQGIFSGFNFANSVTIISIVILLVILIYGYKKNIKN